MPHYSIMKIYETRELQQTTSHSSDICFKDFMKRYGDYTKKPYPFLVYVKTLSSDNLLQSRKNLL